MKSLMRKFKRSLAFISDMHTGSPAAPWPEGMQADEAEGKRAIPPGPKQRILNGYWADAIKAVKDFECDTVFLMGDLVHGNNRKEGGRMTMTPDLDCQTDACVKLLEPMVKGRSVYSVSGSKYHDSWDVRIDRKIAKRFGGKHLGMLANVPLKGTDRKIQIQHGVSSAAIYREMVMGRYRLFLDAAEGRGKLPFHIDMVIMGHLHFFTHIHNESGHMVNLPCWADWLPWKGSLIYYGKTLPNIGFCIILIDEDDRFMVLPFLYPRPLVGDALIDKK